MWGPWEGGGCWVKNADWNQTQQDISWARYNEQIQIHLDKKINKSKLPKQIKFNSSPGAGLRTGGETMFL